MSHTHTCTFLMVHYIITWFCLPGSHVSCAWGDGCQGVLCVWWGMDVMRQRMPSCDTAVLWSPRRLHIDLQTRVWRGCGAQEPLILCMVWKCAFWVLCDCASEILGDCRSRFGLRCECYAADWGPSLLNPTSSSSQRHRRGNNFMAATVQVMPDGC